MIQLNIFLLSFCVLFVNTNCYNANENIYAFRVFENFEATKDIFLREMQLVKKLIEIRNTLKDELDNLKDISVFEKPNVSNEDPNKNPLNQHDGLDPIKAFGLLKWSVVNLKQIKNSLQEKLEYQPKLKAELMNLTKEFPDLHDLDSASKAIVFLQDTYRFNLSAAANGVIEYTTSDKEFKQIVGKEKLSFFDMFTLAESAYMLNLYSNCIYYLREGYSLSDVSTWKKDFKTAVEKLKGNVIQFNNNYITKKNSFIGGNYKVLKYLVDNNLKRKKKQPKVVREKGLTVETSEDFFHENYYRDLCGTGGPLVFPRGPKDHTLKCRLIHHHDPYLKIGPHKIEFASETPFISVIHDFLTEDEIKFMVDYSIPRLSRSRQYGTDNSDITSKHDTKSGKKVRIVHKTVQCWIDETNLYDGVSIEARDSVEKGLVLDLETISGKNRTVFFPVMDKLAFKIEKATNLKVTSKYSATPFQTTNYGLGGLCEIHMDPHGYIEGKEVPITRTNLKLTGDMLATTMAWLDDVEAGGATAFTFSKVEKVVLPKRGALAFWYSLDKKGFRDPRSIHGGCPVLKGSKWILNKWIYYFNQFHNFPCSTSPNDYFEPPKGYYRSYTK